MLKTINAYRQSSKIWNERFVQNYADDTFYAFSRGNSLILITNDIIRTTRTITYHFFREGALLCNLLDSKDCIVARVDGFDVTINGEPKIYVQQ